MGHSVLNFADKAEYFCLYVFVHICGVELKKPQYIMVQLLNVFCILWFGNIEIWVRVPEGAPLQEVDKTSTSLLLTPSWMDEITFATSCKYAYGYRVPEGAPFRT